MSHSFCNRTALRLTAYFLLALSSGQIDTAHAASFPLSISRDANEASQNSLAARSTNGLPLRLVAVHQGHSPLAIIEQKEGAEKLQDTFSPGASVFGIGTLEVVREDGVIILRGDTREFLALRSSVSRVLSEVTAGNASTLSAMPSTSAGGASSPELDSAPSEKSAEALKQEAKEIILATVDSTHAPLKIVDRRKLFQNVRNFQDVFQTYQPQMVRDNTGALGFRISNVPPESPVAALGIQPGDTITRLNGQAFNEPVEAYSYIRKMSNEDVLTLDVEREGKTEKLSFASSYVDRLDGNKLEEIKSKQIKSLEGAAQSVALPASTQTPATANQL